MRIREVTCSEEGCRRARLSECPVPLCEHHLRKAVEWFNDLRPRERTAEESAIVADVERAKAAAAARKGVVYFIKIERYIKIGYTADLASRLKNYGIPVELLHSEPGAPADELALHRKFRLLRAHGREYYEDTGKIRQFITALKASGTG